MSKNFRTTALPTRSHNHSSKTTPTQEGSERRGRAASLSKGANTEQTSGETTATSISRVRKPPRSRGNHSPASLPRRHRSPHTAGDIPPRGSLETDLSSDSTPHRNLIQS